MPDLNWPRAILVAIVALGLFFGANHYYQKHFKTAPFLERLSQLEGVACAEIITENGSEKLRITPESSYRGLLEDLACAVRTEAAAHRREPLPLEITDQRNGRLHQYAAAASPALHEAARRGRYRDAAAGLSALAADSGLTEFYFTADSEFLYLQARDADCYLFQMVPLPPLQGGGSADA